MKTISRRFHSCYMSWPSRTPWFDSLIFSEESNYDPPSPRLCATWFMRITAVMLWVLTTKKQMQFAPLSPVTVIVCGMVSPCVHDLKALVYRKLVVFNFKHMCTQRGSCHKLKYWAVTVGRYSYVVRIRSCHATHNSFSGICCIFHAIWTEKLLIRARQLRHVRHSACKNLNGKMANTRPSTSPCPSFRMQELERRNC
jgi:hypothetical protein